MGTNKIIVEVCVDSIDSALAAQQGGAERIELCQSLSEGGTTPSFAMIEAALRLLNIKAFVLIRPRGGDFLYNDTEFAIMQMDIHCCGKMGCHGVVIGMLNVDGSIDVRRCAVLIDIAHQYNMQVTFHRAFDRCRDLSEGLGAIIDLGCERVLTSGGYPTAPEGAVVLRQLVSQSQERIIVMPGAGITPENAAELVKNTRAKEIHGSFRSAYSSEMVYHNPHVKEDVAPLWRTDPEKVRKIIMINWEYC
ncbi:MAG: copper homeostasis protein CutC [Prevotellaceae bacterium]|jgi:copper homeostasis protein|nr:copper homeostasis protein CutC [Prevotellaceae bacterium]